MTEPARVASAEWMPTAAPVAALGPTVRRPTRSTAAFCEPDVAVAAGGHAERGVVQARRELRDDTGRCDTPERTAACAFREVEIAVTTRRDVQGTTGLGVNPVVNGVRIAPAVVIRPMPPGFA